MEAIDFTSYEKGNLSFGGAERKECILVPNGDGTCSSYMLKFQRQTAFGALNNHVTEHIGSRIFDALDLPAQKTFLGTYCGCEVVACKTIQQPGESFISIASAAEKELGIALDQVFFPETVNQVADACLKGAGKVKEKQQLWRMYLVDALVANPQSHYQAWGFLKSADGVRVMPAFNNDSCLFPEINNPEVMADVICSEEKTLRYATGSPRSPFTVSGKFLTYGEFIAAHAVGECDAALIWLMETMDLAKLNQVIDDAPLTHQMQRSFYKHILEARVEYMLRPAYEELMAK